MRTVWMTTTTARAMMAAVMASAGSASAVAAAQPACPMIGATYVARTATGAAVDRYRLVIGPPAPGTVAETWRFQTLDRATGRQRSELRMRHSCPNGNGACSVSLPGRSAAAGGPSSDVIRLNRDFTPATGDAAAYALVLPGFAQANWLFTAAQLASADLTLAPGSIDGPDLSGETVWVLTACGGAARRR